MKIYFNIRNFHFAHFMRHFDARKTAETPTEKCGSDK
jgi:hypothetical protein